MNIDKMIEILGLEKATIRDDELTASCPFASLKHKKGVDRNPSFGINLNELVYNCFSCGSKGTLEDLVQEVLGCSLTEAMDIIEKDFDINSLEHVFEYKKEPRVLDIYIDPYLPEGKLAEFDKVEGVPYELYVGNIEDSMGRLIKCKIYPIRERNGKLVGAVARSVEGRYHKNLWGVKKKNYLLGEETITAGAPIIVVEGPGDRAALLEAGYSNVVAIMGSNPSSMQTSKLLALSNIFYIWGDKDEAGKNLIKWAISNLELIADKVYIVDPFIELASDENDPRDVFTKRGKQGVQEVLSRAKPSIEFEANLAGIYLQD